MSHVAAKAFKTVNRKFGANDPVSASDIDPSNALTFEQYCERGFIVAKDAPAAEPEKSRKSRIL